MCVVVLDLVVSCVHKRERLDGRLAGHVRGAEGRRVALAAGRDVDDAAEAVAQHGRQHLVRGVEDAVDVAGHHRAPVRARHLV